MATTDSPLHATEDAHHEHARLIASAGRPLVWLVAAILGLVLTGAGVAIDAYRHDNGAAAAELISRSNPGLIVALAGLAMTALGLLVTFTLLAFVDAPSAETVARRGAGVVAAWLVVTCAGVAAVTYATTSGLTVGHAGHPSPAASIAPAAPTIMVAATPTAIPGVGERVTLQGALTLDGRPLDARFLGAEVIRDGLIAACQLDVVSVSGGKYEITVMSDAEARGCGAPGGQVVLWTSVDGPYIYSAETLAWPGGGDTVTFDAHVSAAAPNGARQAATAFKGHVVHGDGTRLRGGTVVEAFVGDTRCGVAAVRRDDEAWFTLLVAGPQVTGCAADGRIRFRVNGTDAGSATNDLKGSGLTIELAVD